MVRERLNMTIIATVLTACLLSPSFTLAQDATELRQPRNNVKGGSVSSRRPGLTITESQAVHIERQNNALKLFGGAVYTATDEEPGLGETMRLATAQAVMDLLNDLADQLLQAIQLAKLLATTTTTS